MQNLQKGEIIVVTWMGSSDGCGKAKGWTKIANCIPDVAKRSAVKGICFI